MRHKTLALALVWVLLPLGCSDDDTNGTQDLGARQDGPLVNGDTNGQRPEGGTPGDGPNSQADQSQNPVCEPACQQESRTLCVTDPAQGQCVQCTENAHCASMPDVDGPYCNTTTQRCVECLEPAHCTSHPAGSVCDNNGCVCNTSADCDGGERFGPDCVQLPSYGRCGCESDDVCTGTSLGSKCFVALNHKCVCYEQADCAGNGARTSCHLPYYYAEYGHCAPPCTADAECKLERLERCNTANGACVECIGDENCGGVDRGFKCINNRCSCESNADCPQGSECSDLFDVVQCREP